MPYGIGKRKRTAERASFTKIWKQTLFQKETSDQDEQLMLIDVRLIEHGVRPLKASAETQRKKKEKRGKETAETIDQPPGAVLIKFEPRNGGSEQPRVCSTRLGPS